MINFNLNKANMECKLWHLLPWCFSKWCFPEAVERGSDGIYLLYLLYIFTILITGTLIFHRFGEESMIRIIRWLEKEKVPLDSSLLDIGTGNGVLLVELVGILRSLCF